MAGLIGGLLQASKALAAQQAGVQVAGRNLANVNTPNYARQRVILGDRVIVETREGSRGSGVEALGVKQIRDRFLDAEVTREIAQTASLTAQRSALEIAEGSLGEGVDRSSDSAFIGAATSSTNGLASAVNDFFNGFDELAANPSDTGAKQVLLQRADLLATKFNSADQRLAGLQTDLTEQINGDTDSANGLLQQIAELNQQIQQAEIRAADSAVDLRDQRQGRLEELAKFITFQASVIPDSYGQIQIAAKDGAGSDVLLLEKTNVQGRLTFNGTQITGGTANTVLGLTGGALAGNLAARDGAVQTLRDDLRKTAEQLASAVNAAYNPTGTTGNFFEVPPAAGLLKLDASLNVSSLKTTDSANAGANELALAVADVAQRKFSVGSGDAFDGTIGNFYNSTVTGFGAKLSNVNRKLDDQTTVQDLVTSQRDAVSGVSLDEEVADLMRYQRAYQASARVVNVIDGMLDTLINGLGIH